MLTTFDMDEYVYEAFHAGASGFPAKDVPSDSSSPGSARSLGRLIYKIAATRMVGDGSAAWAEGPTIKRHLGVAPFGFLTLEEMWASMLDELTTTPAANEMGRLAQLPKAAGLTAPEGRRTAKPTGSLARTRRSPTTWTKSHDVGARSELSHPLDASA